MDYHLSFTDFIDNILVDFPSQNHLLVSSCSNASTSVSDDGETIDERRRKRLISNRESAKRSPNRKQKLMEDLKNQIIRYETGNQELVKRLQFLNQNKHVVCQENDRLRLESLRLQQKLYTLRQPLANQDQLQPPLLSYAWPCNNNVTIINEQNQPTLIRF